MFGTVGRVLQAVGKGPCISCASFEEWHSKVPGVAYLDLALL